MTFDSITVHDDREGIFSGDGEYDLYAYVQGKKISLTDATSGYICIGITSTYKCLGLMDVSPGQKLNFNPGTEMSVELPETISLSIRTVGVEVDGCGRLTLPDQFKFGTGLYNSYWDLQDLDECEVITKTTNLNDALGFVSKHYDPTDYGAGSHTEKSGEVYGHDYDNPDYTLRYTISVTPPTTTEKKQTDFGTNNTFSSQLNNDLGLKLEES